MQSLTVTTQLQLRSIRHFVSATVFQSVVAALVLCRLDYCNGTLVGLLAYLVHRLQSAQNAAVRFLLRRSGHITDALVSLHWLRVPERIIFKIAMQTYVYRVLSMAMPRSTYTAFHMHRSQTSRHDKDCGLLYPPIYSFLLSDCLLLDVAPSLTPALAYGTTFYWSMLPQHSLFSPPENY